MVHAIGRPQKSALSQNSCFQLPKHKILYIYIILSLTQLNTRSNDYIWSRIEWDGWKCRSHAEMSPADMCRDGVSILHSPVPTGAMLLVMGLVCLRKSMLIQLSTHHLTLSTTQHNNFESSGGLIASSSNLDRQPQHPYNTHSLPTHPPQFYNYGTNHDHPRT
jgi:hypothetical protein